MINHSFKEGKVAIEKTPRVNIKTRSKEFDVDGAKIRMAYLDEEITNKQAEIEGFLEEWNILNDFIGGGEKGGID